MNSANSISVQTRKLTLWIRRSLDEGQFRRRIRESSKKVNTNITCAYKVAFPSKRGHKRDSIKMSLSNQCG